MLRADIKRTPDVTLLSDSRDKPYAKYFESKEYADFTLICNDEVEIPVHRMFLAQESDVFKELFNKKKKPSAFVKLFDSSTMTELLSFIYTGEANFSSIPLTSTLLQAAIHFRLRALEERCVDELSDRVNKQNVFDIWNAAVLNGAEQLDHQCQLYIAKSVI